jgi:hypothetical protein
MTPGSVAEFVAAHADPFLSVRALDASQAHQPMWTKHPWVCPCGREWRTLPCPEKDAGGVRNPPSGVPYQRANVPQEFMREANRDHDVPGRG